MYTQEEYEAKRNARYERLLAAAEKAAKESAANWNQAHQMADCIPFGQPILVGHYSEGRDRNFRTRIENKHRRGYELHQKAEYYRSRAESTQDNHAIMSDDPNAINKLADKVAELEKQQALYKAINKAHAAYLKNPASLETCGLTEELKDTIRNYKPEYSWEPHPIPPYRLTNLSANIRQAKERAQRVEKQQAQEDTTRESNGIKIEYTPTENRIRIYYPGKPDEATRNELKCHGYRWAPSFGAWSGYYNWNAKQYADSL